MRNKHISMVHIAKHKLGLNDETYRAWLLKNTGKSSCKDLSDHELTVLVSALRSNGALDDAPFNAHTVRAADKPTPAQWGKMETLARQIGFDDVISPPFCNWVKNTAKVDNPRFLSKQGISDVIAGLERWCAFKRKKAENATPDKIKP